MEYKILINTITAWDEPPRARHQFAYALAKRMPVVFVTRNHTGWFNLKVSEPEKNILLVEPAFPMDYRIRYRLPVINELYQIWLFSRLKKKFKDYCVVNFDFTATQICKYFKDRIYYCHDEYAGNGKYTSKIIDKYILACEKQVANKSSFCITTARYLTNKLKAYNPSTYEIPLGVPSLTGVRNYEGELKKDYPIKLALMGVINERHSSISLLNRIIDDKRFYLYLIGSVEKSFIKKIKHFENIEITGVLKGKELQEMIDKIDIGLAIYNEKSVNPGTTPNKLWHYLASGKPVIVNNLPNLQYFSFPEKSVYRFDYEEQIIDSVIQAYQENRTDLINERIKFAADNTWDHRLDDFIKLYADKIK